MAEHESVHSKWHSLLVCLHLLSEAKESSPGADQALVDLLEYWGRFEEWEALWTASEREGLPALVSALKKSLAVTVCQPAHSSVWLEAAVGGALSLFHKMLKWQLHQPAGWCTPKWRPLLDLLLAWLPSKIAGAWQDAAVEGRLQERAEWLISVTVASVDMLVVLLMDSAGEWASSAMIVQGLEEWLLVVDLAAAEHGPGSMMPVSAQDRHHLLGRMRVLAQWALVDGRGRPWQGGKTAELLVQKRQLLQVLSRHIFHIPFGGDEDWVPDQPDGSTTGLLQAYLGTSLLACPPLQPALLGLLTTSSSALQGLLHTHKLAGMWTFAACEALEQALATAGDGQRLRTAALQLQGVTELLSESSGLLCRLHDQQVKAGVPGTDIMQAALYPGCAAALRALQITISAVTGLEAASQGPSSAAQQGEPSQDAAALQLCHDSERQAYCALVAQLWGMQVVVARYRPGIGPAHVVTPASSRCLVGDGLLPTLRSARLVLGMHGSPQAARLMRAALPALCRQLPWPGSFTAQQVQQHVLAIALSVVADHLEVLEGRPERLAELGQELAEVTAQLLAAQGRLLVLDEWGGLRDHTTTESQAHWDSCQGWQSLWGG